jgi:hypothetical protein
MQHQALKYSPSLVNDGQFTQGLSHWFGSYVSHVKNETYNMFEAKCVARLGGAYQPGMPYGISQYIDAPEMHSYPASRVASLVRLIPLSSQLALLVTTNDTLLEGAALVPGIEGESSPADQFQHPFRWQDSGGAVAIEPTSLMSLRGVEGYAGEYTVGSLLVVPAPNTREVVHHRLYVAPTVPLSPEASDETYGSVRVECVPSEDLETGTLVLRSPDEDQLNRLRAVITQLSTANLTVSLGADRQVRTTALMGGVVAGAPNEFKLEVQYAAIQPGGLAPDQTQSFTEWALFRITDVECKYTMPLYGYRYTLAYSYRDRRPRRAELTFRGLDEDPNGGGYGVNGFGTVKFRVSSDAAAQTVFGGMNNYLRNVEVLRAESRNKVVGRPMLTIPVLDVSEPLQRSRTVTRVRKVAGLSQTSIIEADNTVVDTQARPVFGFSWEEGITGSQPGKLWLPGIINPELLQNPGVGDSLGPVVLTGHLAAQDISPNSSSGGIRDVANFLAHVLDGSTDELTAELFYGEAVGSPGELYVNFTRGGESIYLSTDLGVPVVGSIEGSTYIVAPEFGDTLGIRGAHFGSDAEIIEVPRVSIGSTIVFSDAEEPLLFLNDRSYLVDNVYVRPLGGGAPIISFEIANIEQLDPGQSISISPLVGTQVGIEDSSETQADFSYITDVSMWLGERTSDLPLEGQSGRDLLERHTDPLDSLFPKGTVMLYAGGGTCPAGFKPVQAQAGARAPGIFGVGDLPAPLQTIYNADRNVTTLKFATGALPLLRDPQGNPINRSSAVTVPIDAPSLEVDSDGSRLPALTSLGDVVQLSQVLQIFRNAVEVGMTLRVQESTAEDGAPLVNEDRGFLVVDDQDEDIPQSFVAQSALRSARPSQGGGGYRTGQSNEDVSNAPNVDTNSQSYHWGRGYGTVTYPNADPNTMAVYGSDPENGDLEGYNRAQDQALLKNTELPADVKDALSPNGEFDENYLIPKYPTRFTQTPQFAPIAPNIAGQRERFFFDDPSSVDPRTDFYGSPASGTRNAPAILMVCRGFVNDVQIEMGDWGGESTIGVVGGDHGYLPNPAWDLSNPETIDTVNFPAQPISEDTDLLRNTASNSPLSQGLVSIWEGMVFFTRIYGKCPVDDWDEEKGRPKPDAQITGWFSGRSSNRTTLPGIGFLIGTMPIMTFAVGSTISRRNSGAMNINAAPYDFPYSGANNARGNAPRSGRAGDTWPTSMRMIDIQQPAAGLFLLQMTPITLYGQPGQPQEFGEVSYLDWSTGNYETALGRSPGPAVPQASFIYTRPEEDAPINTWGTVGPGTDTSSLVVLGDASGLETGARSIYAEPSGYLKYGSVGARMDYGPGRHSHDLERNPNLLGPSKLAQPDETSGRYLTALPSVHGHLDAADGRSLLPVANLFTSCIKL